jgi:hypothetical protein
VSPVATGTVYIVNTTNQLVSLVLNYNALPDLGPAHGHAQHYAPTLLTAPRSNANRINDPVFAEENHFEVMFYGVRNHYKIIIELEQYPSNGDIVLYIFYNHLVLAERTTNNIIFNSLPTHLQGGGEPVT